MAIWALVTGASEGLGREFAILAAQSGFDVILTARQEDKLQTLSHELQRAYHVSVVVLPADLADPEAAERLWRDASNGRQIGILINNAGLGRNGHFADDTNWPRETASISVNVVAATILMKRAVAHMLEQGSGRVLNVASTAAFMPGPHMAVYHATKAYMLSLSEAVATELRGTGVSVTALCPGPTETAFFDADNAVRATLITKLGMAPAQSVAAAGWAAMERGKRVKVTGVSNMVFANLPRFAPRTLVAWIAQIFLKRRG
ncbi:SDR family NAD(P)-dependent oxidoreductase [Pseudorhodobacter ferrugineus]|uniref:SDR family NAD(P)-dependent oxidoreductase n=1 Tax=Pseudorhodobacter ferrugineus TaxID=77008 RepID=UPI00040AC47A|nr:SDR family oxidoreductase [Pseudorhodobacter ferrugineus]